MIKCAFRLWAVIGVMSFGVVAIGASLAVYQSWHDSQALAAPGDLVVTESPSWQSMDPKLKWTSATDLTPVPVPAPDYVRSQQSIYHVLKKEDTSSTVRVDMAAYFDASSKTSYGQYIYIADPVFRRYNSGPNLGDYILDASGHRIPARNCQTYDPTNEYSSSEAFITVTLSYDLIDGSTRTAVYQIPENNVCPYNATTAPRPTNTNSEADTANNNFFARYPIPNFAGNPNAKIEPDLQLYKVRISIAYDSNVPVGVTTGGIDVRQQLVFRVKISNTNCTVGLCRRYVGMVSVDNSMTSRVEPNYSTLTRLTDDVSNIPGEVDRFYGAQRFEFGLPCNEGPSTKSVSVYDVDNNGSGHPVTSYHVETLDPVTGAWSMLPSSAYSSVVDGDRLDVDTVYDYNYRDDLDPLTPWVPRHVTIAAGKIVPTYGSGVISTAAFQMLPDVRYRLVVDPVWSNNLLSVGLPTDSIYGLTTCPPPTSNVGCVNNLPVGLPFNTTVQIRPAIRLTNYSGPLPPALGGPSLNLKITSPSGVITQYNAIIYTALHEPPVDDLLTANGVALNVTEAGKYQFEWNLSGVLNSSLCTAEASSGNQPYFNVLGGDILAGISLGLNPMVNAGIISWNRDNVGGGGYAGATGQLAALASEDISHFITNSGSPGEPSALAFANTMAAGSKYGGDFDAMPAVPSYVTAAVARAGGTPTTFATNNLDIDSLGSGIYEYSGLGDLTIYGSLTPGKNVTIIVRNGASVYISANITYTPGFNLTDIPQLNVYTTGSIIVDNDVNEIHGIYVAEGPGSRFYTCGLSAAQPIDYTAMASSTIPPTLASQCDDTSLTVYGSVVAHEVILGRTGGTWANGGSPSETFKHSPEAWLSRPFGGTGSGDTFDNYVSLPPIL